MTGQPAAVLRVWGHAHVARRVVPITHLALRGASGELSRLAASGQPRNVTTGELRTLAASAKCDPPKPFGKHRAEANHSQPPSMSRCTALSMAGGLARSNSSGANSSRQMIESLENPAR